MLDADEAYFKEHGEPLFSSHMIDLSEEEVDWNIEVWSNAQAVALRWRCTICTSTD